MKNLFLLSIFSLLLMSFSNSNNNLILKGDISDNNEILIEVFQKDKTNTDSWERKRNYYFTKNYNLNLKADTEYQIHFTNEKGYKKILNISKGNKGNWKVLLDINFKSKAQYAILYQVKTLMGTYYEINIKSKIVHKNIASNYN